ncbi:hypothetical protein WEI85_00615 [Actinomycetes bacterium KLBMP 9797]
MPTILSVLDLSTAHLPEEVCDDLSGEPGVIAHRVTYGWLMWVPADPDAFAAETIDPMPEEVLAIQRYARRLGCQYVLFDRDAEQVDELPTWQW